MKKTASVFLFAATALLMAAPAWADMIGHPPRNGSPNIIAASGSFNNLIDVLAWSVGAACLIKGTFNLLGLRRAGDDAASRSARKKRGIVYAIIGAVLVGFPFIQSQMQGPLPAPDRHPEVIKMDSVNSFDDAPAAGNNQK